MMTTTMIIIIGTARIVFAAKSMQRSSVHPSVYPGRQLQQRAVGLLLWARRVRDVDRLLHGRRRSSTGRRTAHRSKCGHCHVFSVRM